MLLDKLNHHVAEVAESIGDIGLLNGASIARRFRHCRQYRSAADYDRSKGRVFSLASLEKLIHVVELKDSPGKLRHCHKLTSPEDLLKNSRAS